MEWPGLAAVVVCIVHLAKTENWRTDRFLDGKPVQHLSPFLIPVKMDGEPRLLNANIRVAFKGCEIGSLGFLFQDEQIGPLAKMLRPDGTPLIKEYIGGSDLNASPVPKSGRFIIDSDGLTWSELPQEAICLLESTLRSDLDQRGKDSDGEWWHFRRPSNEMRKMLVSGKGGLAVARVSSTFGITNIDTTYLPNSDIILFDLPSDTGFCVLQSRCHEYWSKTISGTMKDDLRYAATDCFTTFPFPDKWDSNPDLAAAGRAYLHHRNETMKRSNEGLTKTYNRFHDPEECDAKIEKLRELHAAMDRAVLDAYRWNDISTSCDFLLDYEIDEVEWGNKKKPWRYRWPDEVRDKVLARLLELNAKRAKEEELSGASAAKKAAKKIERTAEKKAPTKQASKKSYMEGLF